MAELLRNRALIRRNLLRLLSSDSSDRALTENGEEENEVVDQCIQYGLWNAQKFLITLGFREWLKNTAAITWSAAAADGTRSAALPTDFLRFAGDERRGALLTSAGRVWGELRHTRDKRTAGSSSLWIENGYIVLGRGAEPPTGLYFEYHYRHPTLTGDDEEEEGGEIDFPEDWRPMIPVEAAHIAVTEGWYMVGGDGAQRIAGARAYWREQAGPWVRQTQEPRKLHPPDVIGSHIFI